MRTLIILLLTVATWAQKEEEKDSCMENKGPFACRQKQDDGCRWHDDKRVCYNEEYWRNLKKKDGVNTEACKAKKSERTCKETDGCSWHEKGVCYDDAAWKKRQAAEMQRGAAGCLWLWDMDTCKQTKGCAVDDSGEKPVCRREGGCYVNKDEKSCKAADRCSWVKDKCMGIMGISRGGGVCQDLGRLACGRNDGCTWLTGRGGVGYCGRTDDCRAQDSKDKCDDKGDECYWVKLSFNGREICRPTDGVRCAVQQTPEACEKHSESCIWAERAGGQEACMREDINNEPETTPCVQAKDKKSCDELPENLNCGWTTQFGFNREVIGATGRCLHLACSEIDDKENCSQNWQCNWIDRRKMCISDRAVHCDLNTKKECDTEDECRWVWSEARDDHFCTSVCLIGEVRRDEHLCRTFDSCAFGAGRGNEEICRVAVASADKQACVSARYEDDCKALDEKGLGCFWDKERRDCFHESCETYEDADTCEGNWQCKWLLGRKICRSLQTFWCNGDDEETCKKQPSCAWVEFFSRAQGKKAFGCRHECVSYKSQKECINDDSCFWGERGGHVDLRNDQGQLPDSSDENEDDSSDDDSSDDDNSDDESNEESRGGGGRPGDGNRGEGGRPGGEGGRPGGDGQNPIGPGGVPLKSCRAKAQDSDTSACAHQYTKKDCDTFAISASVGCVWETVLIGGNLGICRHEACYDYNAEAECNKDKYCKWIIPPGEREDGREGGRCISPFAYWCKGESEAQCQAAGDDCAWIQNTNGEYSCRHGCWQYDKKEACNEQSDCMWGANVRNRERCYFKPAEYDAGQKVEEDCVQHWTKDACLAADEDHACGWMLESDFEEGGDYEGRQVQPGCRHLDCYQFDDEDECEANKQCNWHGRRQQCTSPVDYHCSNVDDEVRCNAISDCHWHARSFVSPRSGDTVFREGCTSSCATHREEDSCNLDTDCAWTSGGQFNNGRCFPAPEKTIDQTFCNELSNEKMCIDADDKMGCIWQYSGIHKANRCVHVACSEQTTEGGCNAISQCKWRVTMGGAGEGRCFAPSAPNEENPCMSLNKEACEKLDDKCVWAETQRGFERCMLPPEDNLDDSFCKEHDEEALCLKQPRAKQCVWLKGRETCIHAGCRNNEKRSDCETADQCEWVWRTAAQNARFGLNQGGWRCRSAEPCDKDSCEAPACTEKGTYLDKSKGCCGQCVPDDCDMPFRQTKNGCKKAENCVWQKKGKKCYSKCPLIPKDYAKKECMQEGLVRVLIKDEQKCTVPQCVDPAKYCAKLSNKKHCAKAADGQAKKICEWKGKCIATGGKVDCGLLDRRGCKDAEKDCVHVRENDKCVSVGTACKDMTEKDDCKAMSKAHLRANKNFKGCDWDKKTEQCNAK